MTKRRSAPGQGSISLRKDGLYCVRWPIPGQKPGCLYARTLREAQQKLRAAITRREQGLPEPNRKLTVKQYLTDWLEDTKRPHIRPGTYEAHERSIRLYLSPLLGHHLLADLTPQHVREMMADLTKRNFAPTYIARTRAVLVAALQDALKDSLVFRNVAALTSAPRITHTRTPGLTLEHVRVLLKAIQGTQHEALICVTLCFGLRRGEVLGLTWADCELDRATLRIRRQVIRVDGKVQIVATTKSGKERVVPIPVFLATTLRSHRDKQLFYQRTQPIGWNSHNLVFPSRRGTPMDPQYFNWLFGRILSQAGLPHYRVHDLRHSCVSLLRSLNVPDSVIMSIAGHSNLKLTHYYGDVVGELKAEAMDKMGGLLFGG